MDYLRELPILERLDPVELAKMLPELREVRLSPGDRVEGPSMHQVVFILTTGRVELRSESADGSIWLAEFGPGEFFGESALLDEMEFPQQVVALESSQLVGIPKAIFAGILRGNPAILEDFTHRVLTRAAHRLVELKRLRRMMAAYTDQLWREVDEETPESLTVPQQEAAAAAAVGPSSDGTSLGRLRRTNLLDWRPPRSLVAVGLATAFAGAIALWPMSLPVVGNGRYVVAVLLWGSMCWLFNALPDFVVALATCLGLAMFGLAAPALAFSGFASSTWFLLLGVWCIGAAIARTGLLYRIALHILKRLPTTYVGQSLALAVTGALMTPILPSPQGRIVMSAPLTLELGEAMRFGQNSNGSAGLAMASFLGFGQMYFLFLNGTTTGILAWSLLPPNVQAQVSWGYWLLAALPLGLIVFGLTYWAILRLLPASTTQGISRDLIEAQLHMLGPMRADERTGLLVMLGVLLAFITTPFHAIEPAWFAVIGMLVLVATDVLTGDAMGRDVNWGFLLFFGAVISIANVARTAGLDATLGHLLEPIMAPVLAHPAAAVLLVGVITLLLRMALSSIQVIPLLTIALVPVFTHAGYNPFGIVLTVVAVSTTFLAPLLSPNYMAMFAGTRGRMFHHDQVRPLAWVYSLILLVGILASVPYWLLLKAL